MIGRVVKIVATTFGILLIRVGSTLIKYFSTDEEHTNCNVLVQRPTNSIQQSSWSKMMRDGSADTVFTAIGGWSKVRTIDVSCGTRIYEALTSNGVTITVKQVSLSSLKVSIERRWYNERKIELENESSILSRLQHKHIVRYLGCYKTEETVDMWYEYIRGNSIKELYLEKKFDINNIPAYTRQILKALRYLHKNNVVHRDLSCSNILLDDKGVVKLAGFHFAQQIEGNKAVPRDKELDEWVKWAAPEILIPETVSDVWRCLRTLIPEGSHCGPASDIWSLGCAVLEMATASVPYSSMPWWDAVAEVFEGKLPMLSDNLPNDCREFIETCLQFKPSNRPTASQLLCHPFIAHAKTSGSPQSQG